MNRESVDSPEQWRKDCKSACDDQSSAHGSNLNHKVQEAGSEQEARWKQKAWNMLEGMDLK
jgi:hypothetical protein